MTLKIAICDDEKKYIDVLEKLLIQYTFAHETDFIIDTYIDSNQFLKEYDSPGKYNILFMDIEMPGINGIDVVYKIRKYIDRELVTVFESNYPEYMCESLSVHPYQFIQKPVSYDMLEKVMNDIVSDIGELKASFIKCKDYTGHEFTINTNEIRFIEVTNAKKREISINLREKNINTRGILSQIEKTLPANIFFRISRSSIINLQWIRYIKDRTVVFDNGSTVSASRRNMETLTELYVNVVTQKVR